MNKPDYFGREYYLVAGLQVGLKDNFGALFMVCTNLKHSPTARGRCRVLSGKPDLPVQTTLSV
eukprot:1949594-Amphidinium_carterae.1